MTKRPLFYSKIADDTFSLVIMWVLSFALLLLPIAAVWTKDSRFWWITLVVAVYQCILSASQDKDAPWRKADTTSADH